MMCEWCDATEGLADHTLAHTSAITVTDPPTWTLCPHCRQAADDAWAKIDAALVEVGRFVLTTSIQLLPNQWLP